MSEADQLIGPQQDALIWKGLQTLGEPPDWLVAARDPNRVRAALSEAITEFRSGELTLHECDSINISYRGESWSGFYDLTVSRSGESSRRSVHLDGTIFPPGVLRSSSPSVENSLGDNAWHAVIPALNLELRPKQPEGVLSSLELLTDPEQSRRYLMSCIRAGSPTYRDLQIEACRPKVVRYKPGSRCTIVYDLDYPSSADHRWPNPVIAKTYRKEKGQNAYRSMQALWNSPLASSGVLKIAEPLAYDAETRVMIQGPIRQEKTLKDLTVMSIKAGTKEAWGELAGAMRKTARALAELHNSGVKLDAGYGWQDDELQTRGAIGELSAAIPQLALAGLPLIERLSSLEAGSCIDPLVPSHGTFRPAQVLIYREEIGFIDFDSCCNAEPAKDLGLFLCAFLRAGMATVDFDDIEVGPEPSGAARSGRFQQLLAMSGEFLDEYERCHMPVSRQRVALFEALELFILILHAWTKVKVRELNDIMYVLEHFLPAHGILAPR